MQCAALFHWIETTDWQAAEQFSEADQLAVTLFEPMRRRFPEDRQNQKGVPSGIGGLVPLLYALDVA